MFSLSDRGFQNSFGMLPLTMPLYCSNSPWSARRPLPASDFLGLRRVWRSPLAGYSPLPDIIPAYTPMAG